MPAKFVRETDIIDVANPPMLIYGQPGAGKTSLAQTGESVLTLDFDAGSHRSAFRKDVLQFDSWEDVVEVQRNGIADAFGPGFQGFKTIVLDTIGSLLKLMGNSIIASNAKLGTRVGGLSMQGWGVLKTTFDTWLATLKQAGKQVVMVAHEKEEKDGDQRMMRPEIQGGSYAIVLNSSDIVGYLSYRNNQRFITFEPTDAYFAKNGAGLKSQPIPDFNSNPDFLAKLLTQATQNLGKTSAGSAALAALVKEWEAKILAAKDLDEFNALLPGLSKLDQVAKAQVWALIKSEAEKAHLAFNAKKKKFEMPEGADAAS